MIWEQIGKIAATLACAAAITGIFYLFMRIIFWKHRVDSAIEVQTEVNKELFQALKDIKDTVEKEIPEERSEE